MYTIQGDIKKDKTERYQELGKTPHRKYWALFALTEV